MVKAAVKSFIGKVQAKRFQVQVGKIVNKDIPDFCVAVGWMSCKNNKKL